MQIKLALFNQLLWQERTATALRGRSFTRDWRLLIGLGDVSPTLDYGRRCLGGHNRVKAPKGIGLVAVGVIVVHPLLTIHQVAKAV